MVNTLPYGFVEKFELYYNNIINLEDLANIFGITLEETFQYIKEIGIIEKVKIPIEQKEELKEKITEAKAIFSLGVTNNKEYVESRKVYDELFAVTDKMVRDICKVHEKVRSQLDKNKKYKQRGRVIEDSEAQKLIEEAFKVLEYRTKKMYKNSMN